VALTPHVVVLVRTHACHEAACFWWTLGSPRPPPAPVRVTIPQGPVVPLTRHGLDVHPLEQEPGGSDSHTGPQYRGRLDRHRHQARARAKLGVLAELKQRFSWETCPAYPEACGSAALGLQHGDETRPMPVLEGYSANSASPALCGN
jgi:hypothetical protein